MVKKKMKGKKATSVPTNVAPSAIGQYNIMSTLGKGGFGVVYEGFDAGMGRVVAIKQIELHGASPEELENIQSEVSLLRELSHPNIVQYLDTISDGNTLNIVLEYMESGHLAALCAKLGKQPPESLLANYVTQILAGLQYLHSQGVIHRDIKGANILTTKEGTIKLADFGVATKLSQTSEVDVVGTPYWIAPEIIEMKGESSPACDIWSVGCTVVELLTGKPPYFELNPMAAMYRIVQDDHPALPKDISPELEDFLMQCFAKEPAERPDAQELTQHPWVTVNSTAPALPTSAVPSSSPPKQNASSLEPAASSSFLPSPDADYGRHSAGKCDLGPAVTFTRLMGKLQLDPTASAAGLEALFSGEKALSARLLLLKTGVCELLDAIRVAPSSQARESLLTLTYNLLQKDEAKNIGEDICRKLCRALLSMGLLTLLVAMCGRNSPINVRCASAAIVSFLCEMEGVIFCAAGGLRGLPELMAVDYSSPRECRLAWAALGCVKNLIYHPDLAANDVCRKLSKHGILEVLVESMSEVHQLSDFCVEPPMPEHVKDKKKKMIRKRRNSLRNKPQPIKTLSPRHSSKAQALSKKQSFSRKNSNPIPEPDGPPGEDILEDFLLNGGDVGLPDDSNLSFALTKKIATLINRMASADELVQLRLVRQIPAIVDTAISCSDFFINCLLTNTLAMLVSHRPVLSRIVDMVCGDSPVLEGVILLLERFMLGEGTAMDWAVADTLHVLFQLSTDPTALNSKRPKDRHDAEKSNLQNLVDLGLVENVSLVLKKLNKAEKKTDAGEATYTIRMNQREHRKVNSLGKRKEDADVMRYLFPLLHRVALDADPTVRARFRAQPPETLLPLLALVDYRAQTIDILLQFLLDDTPLLEGLMTKEETVQAVAAILEDAGPSEFLAVCASLLRAFSLSTQISQAYSKCTLFLDAIRGAISVRYASHNNIRIVALKMIHSLVSHSAEVDPLIQALDLPGLLQPLTQDSKSVIVKKLAKSLVNQYLERDEEVPDAAKAGANEKRKYQRRNITKCMICNKKFGLVTRKHACKMCQFIICAKCSPDKAIVPTVDQKKQRRICRNCSTFRDVSGEHSEPPDEIDG